VRLFPLLRIHKQQATSNKQQATSNKQQANGSPFDGVYVGAEGGILNSFANVDSTTNANFLTQYANAPTTANSQKLSSNSNTNLNHNFGVGAFSIGFGKLTQSKVYVGGELALNLANRKTSFITAPSESAVDPFPAFQNNNATLNTNTYTKLNFAEFDMDGKFGTVLTPNMLVYARLGAAFNQLKINSNNTLTINELERVPLTKTSALNVAGTRNLVGLRFGLGGEHFLTQNLVAKLDYVFTWYGKTGINGAANVQNTGPVPPTTTANGLTNSTFAKMNTQTVMVGLSYYFHDGLSHYFHKKAKT
jgi:opacity protein-like surface antigen